MVKLQIQFRKENNFKGIYFA